MKADLIEKGLRPDGFFNRPGLPSLKADLIEKGLRLPYPGRRTTRLPFESRPDREGIKTSTG